MSDDADDSQKTEEPTGKRLEEAHDKGQFAISREFHNWMMLAVTLAMLAWWAPMTFRWLQDRLAVYLEHVHELPADVGGIGNVLIRSTLDAGLTMLLPLLLLMVAGAAATLIQTGWHVSWEAIEPKIDQLNPLNNLKNMMSLNQIVELIKNFIKISVVSVVTYMALRPMIEHVEHYAGIPILTMVSEIERLTFRLIAGVLAVLTIIAAIDFIYQRYDFMKKMRMTKQEIKEEFKQSEGDPVVKGRIRQLRMERARRRMMANVPKADVVITNPTHFAVAMKYDPAAMGAPTVVAKGQDTVALNIRKLAEEHDVPIISNPPLARALYATTDIDQEIPPEHYRAVAEIITYVFKLKGRNLKG